MPKLVLPILGNEETVTRPVVLAVAQQVMELTGIDASKVQMHYPGDVSQPLQPGSTVTGDNEPTFGSGRRLSIDVEEIYAPESSYTNALHRPEHLFIWRDDRIYTGVKPSYTTAQMRINFRYRAPDKQAAAAWRNDIRVRLGEGMHGHMHNLTYHYPIPEQMLAVLKDLYEMREAQAGYGETFEEFFQAGSSPKLTEVANLSGEEKRWHVAETQMRVQGRFAFEGGPERGDQTADGPTWSISFYYEFSFEKPLVCVMNYPLIVHNQLVKAQWRARTDGLTPYQDDAMLRARTFSGAAMSYFEVNHHRGLSSGISIPAFDEFDPASQVAETLRMVSVLSTIDTATNGDPELLMNLNDLGGDYVFDPEILAYMSSEGQNLVKHRCAALLVTLYQDMALRTKITNGREAPVLLINSDLDVRLVEAPNLRKMYHVQVSLITDFDMMTREAQDRLRQHGQAFCLMLQALGETEMPAFIGDTNYISREEFRKAVQRVNRGKFARGNGQNYSIAHVQSLMIRANARE